MIKYASFLFCLTLAATPIDLCAEDPKPTVAIIGTGDMGDSIGPKLAEMDYRVIYGSRDPARESVQALVSRTGADSSATTQKQAAQEAEIVFLVVPWPAMEQVAQNLGNLDGKIVIDVSTPSRQGKDGYLESMVDTSSAEMIQGWNPGARVVKTLLAGSNVIDDPSTLGGRVATFIAADDRKAKEVVAGIVAKLGLEPLDAGPLRHAREIEGWARLWFVPVLQKREQGFEMAVIPSNHWYCIWSDDWFEPVGDSDNLATLPEPENPPKPCLTQ